jgi:hypothetical protein
MYSSGTEVGASREDFPLGSVRIRFPVAPETFQTIPEVVEDARVKPPSPSIVWTSVPWYGALRKMYVIP